MTTSNWKANRLLIVLFFLLLVLVGLSSSTRLPYFRPNSTLILQDDQDNLTAAAATVIGADHDGGLMISNWTSTPSFTTDIEQIRQEGGIINDDNRSLMFWKSRFLIGTGGGGGGRGGARGGGGRGGGARGGSQSHTNHNGSSLPSPSCNALVLVALLFTLHFFFLL